MRLIDADYVLDGIRYIVNDSNEMITSSVVRNAMILLVDSAKTVDAVPVVRCGQCSHSEVCKMDEGDVRYCHIFEMQTEDDYYCADGERKTNGDCQRDASTDIRNRVLRVPLCDSVQTV